MIYVCPCCKARFQSELYGVVECPSCKGKVAIQRDIQEGCQWDRESGNSWINAFFSTFSKAIGDSGRFFSSVALGKGMVRPYIYALIISYVIFAVSIAYQIGFQSLAVGLNFKEGFGADFLPAVAISIPLVIIFLLIFFAIGIPLFTALAMFLRAGLYHLCLLILGAARRDFQTTFRIACYATSPQLFQVVPVLGSLVAWAWQIALDIIGLKEAHETTYGRSALAVFLPAMVCCGGVFLFMIMIAGAVVAAVASGIGR